MRLFLTVFFLMFLFGCKTYKAINPSDIKSVYVLFKGQAERQERYKLFDGSFVYFDLRHSQVRMALEKYKDQLGSLKKLPVNRLDSFIINKKVIKPSPIKALPLTEFGCIQMQSGALISYGISVDVFIDLTNNRLYYSAQ